MKKVGLLITLCVLSSSLAFGQQRDSVAAVKKMSPVLFKDRIVLDFFTSFWQGVPEGIEKKNIQFGFNGSFIFDIPVKKNAPFSFGLGIGVTNFNLYSNGNWGIVGDYETGVTPLPDWLEKKYRKNKITFTNLNIPVELRYRHRSGFKIGAGVRIGTTVDVHTKYFGRAIDGRDDKDLVKNYNIPNRTKIPVEITFRTGWKFVSVYGSYMITPMFETGKGPKMSPISVGISVCPY